MLDIIPMRQTVGRSPVLERLRAPSLADQARGAILNYILDDDFSGKRLPPENELANILGVSRTTVRAALQSLAQDGLITRRRGVGTVINGSLRPWRLGLHRLVGFSTLLRELGWEPTVEVKHRALDTLTMSWAERLGVQPQTRCLVMDKLFRADGVPAIAIVDVVPESSLREWPEDGEVPDAIFAFFERFGNRSVGYAIVEVIPQVADKAVAQKLTIKQGEPYLSLAEICYSDDDDPLSLSLIDVNDGSVRFDIVRRRLGDARW
jgi:GntR family transcriptional regulator